MIDNRPDCAIHAIRAVLLSGYSIFKKIPIYCLYFKIVSEQNITEEIINISQTTFKYRLAI